MNSIDKKQLELINKYIYNKNENSIMKELMYTECIQCGELIKVNSEASRIRRKYCDNCRKSRNKGWMKTNKDIGLPKNSRIKGVYYDD